VFFFYFLRHGTPLKLNIFKHLSKFSRQFFFAAAFTWFYYILSAKFCVFSQSPNQLETPQMLRCSEGTSQFSECQSCLVFGRSQLQTSSQWL